MAAPSNVSLRRNSEELQGLPLDQLELEVVNKHGQAVRVPALNKGFADGRLFIPYTPPPLDSSESQEEWREKMTYLRDDLYWLLKLPHHRFWSQMVYHENLHLCLMSFLSQAPRPFDAATFIQVLTPQEQKLLEDIQRNVFRVYLRMSTFKESKSYHITQDKFAELIYDNYLFDIPKMMDLCALYSQSNGAILQKMLLNIFNAQPKFLEDLDDITPTLLHVFDSFQSRLGIPLQEEAESLGAAEFQMKNPLSSLEIWELRDSVSYLADVCLTLNAFLEMLPLACQYLHEYKAELRIACFYEKAFTPLQIELNGRKSCKGIDSDIEDQVSVTKSGLLKLFRDILSCSCIQPLLDASSETNAASVQVHVSEFFHVLQMALSEKQFICDYQKNFPIEDDIDILRQTKCELDAANTSFLLGSIHALYEGPEPKGSTEQTLEDLAASSRTMLPSTVSESLRNGYSVEDYDSDLLEGACAGPRVGGVELDSLITAVRSVLPDYGEGFIEACLEYYNYNNEVVLNQLLTGSLPDSLEAMDKQMPKKSSVPTLPTTSKESFVLERKNVFDGDEFDVFSNPAVVDKTKVHKGKKSEDAQTLLESRDHVRVSHDIYSRYDQVPEGDEYEDEYDDTYDSMGKWAEEPVTPDPLQERRPFTVPRVLRGKEDYSEDEEEEDAEDLSNQKAPSTSSRQQEQAHTDRRQDWQGRGGPRDQQARPPQQKKQWDSVQGKPKGQGQDDKTQHGRSQKERHKGTYANHNRRSGADRKRNQGMIHT